MSSPNLMSNLMVGNKGMTDLSIQNAGIKPIGNGAGSNMATPTSTLAHSPIPVSLNPTANPPVLPPTVTGSSSLLPVNATPGNPLAPNQSAVPVPTNPNLTEGVDQGKLQKQLVDEYGKGVGGLLASEIANLGSSDSAYMKAYEAAVAMPNSEKLTTLQTTLGNEGISGDSSTAALAQADLLSQESADEGLQEQQLIQSNIKEELGLTQGLQDTANKAQQDTGWSIFGQVAGDIAGAVAGSVIPGL